MLGEPVGLEDLEGDLVRETDFVKDKDGVIELETVPEIVCVSPTCAHKKINANKTIAMGQHNPLFFY